MSKPRGKPTQGARFLFLHNEEWKKLEGMSEMGSPALTVDDIDVTDFDSPAKETIPGSKDFGTFQLSGQYLPKAIAPNQALLESLAGAEAFPCRICLPDDASQKKYTVKECLASVKEFKGGDSKTFDKQTFSTTMKVSGETVRYDDVDVDDLLEESLD
ncbi:MAG: hypothetical protein LBE32_05595 [Burkholderiales bacterium]|jgi:hypothetical protein|nr:hypothetical protein [Burkholderiales bacterium]